MAKPKQILAILVLASALTDSWSATTIDAVNRYADGANFGWMDWHGAGVDLPNGAIMGEYYCSGHVYAANVGWITLGTGSPTNGISYSNQSGDDFGVNQDGLGNLRGYAYGANIGWINFEAIGAPRINLLNGRMSGYAWSANCGWISLSNAVAYVQTDHLSPGAIAPDGLPVAWLLTNFGTTNVDASVDPTGKGMTIGQDYLAGTDPNNPNSLLRITSGSFSAGGTSNVLTWSSAPTRLYYLQKSTDLASGIWADTGLGLIPPDGASTVRGITDTNAPTRLYRVRAVLPLTP